MTRTEYRRGPDEGDYVPMYKTDENGERIQKDSLLFGERPVKTDEWKARSRRKTINFWIPRAAPAGAFVAIYGAMFQGKFLIEGGIGGPGLAAGTYTLAAVMIGFSAVAAEVVAHFEPDEIDDDIDNYEAHFGACALLTAFNLGASLFLALCAGLL